MTQAIETIRDALAAANNMLAHSKASSSPEDYRQRSDVLAKARVAMWEIASQKRAANQMAAALTELLGAWDALRLEGVSANDMGRVTARSRAALVGALAANISST